jgi:hypothetical protein
MPVTIWVEGRDEALKAGRRRKTELVIALMQKELPSLRLLIFIDDSDWIGFKALGVENRGMHFPLKKATMRSPLPAKFDELLVGYDVANGLAVYSGKFEYDCAIYVHDSTCRSDAGFTMTLAHELQHFIQYGNHRKIWAQNAVVTHMKSETLQNRLGFTWLDIPVERQARIMGKWVAKEICGVAATNTYIDEMRVRASSRLDIADWEFAQKIDGTEEYDIAEGTRNLFRRLRGYRAELEKALADLMPDPDFTSVNLGELLGQEC